MWVIMVVEYNVNSISIENDECRYIDKLMMQYRQEESAGVIFKREGIEAIAKVEGLVLPGASLLAQTVKNLPAMQETRV